MSGTAGPGHDDGLAVLVEVTPAGYRRQGVVLLAVGLLTEALTAYLALAHHRSVSPLLPLAAVAYGVYCLVQAQRRVTRTVVRIDRTGLRSGDGTHDHTWDDVALVWVGSPTGLRVPFVVEPVLSVFTRAGVDFARRAGTRPQPRYTFPVGGGWRTAALRDRLAAITDAAVVDGTQVSRRAAAARLAGGTLP